MYGVSFIMCCYNSEIVITEPLTAILKQQTSIPYEIIIVDNNCTDNTVTLIKNLYKKLASDIPIKILKESKPGVVWARKTGCLASEYPYISFIDDDNIINDSWVNNVCHIFETYPKIDILGSNNNALFLHMEEPKWFNAVKGAYACDTQGQDLEEVTYTRKYVFGAGMTFRREVSESVYALPIPLYLSGRKGGKLFSGEDSEIGMKAILLGYTMYTCNQLKIQHIMVDRRMHWSYFRKMSEGHSQSSIILQIYSRMIDGYKPYTRKQIIHDLRVGWWAYVKQYKFRYLNTPNSKSSKRYAHLKGRTLGIIFFFRQYNEIVETIINTLESNKNNLTG